MRFKNTWKLYEWINKNPLSPIGEMMLGLGWSKKKIQRHVDKLVKMKAVKMKMDRVCHLYYPTPVKELINWDEFNVE